MSRVVFLGLLMITAVCAGMLSRLWAGEHRAWESVSERHFPRDTVLDETGKGSALPSWEGVLGERLQGFSEEGLGGPRGFELMEKTSGFEGKRSGQVSLNLLRARKEIEANGPLLAALYRFGSNPSSLGIGRVLDLMEQYPVEFWGLADLAGEAARSGDPDARERLWRAVWIFREAKVLKEEDWDDLGYVLARVNQAEGSGAEPEGKGHPMFHRPFEATKGAPPPKGGGQGGGGSGDDLGNWFGGGWGSESPIGDMGPVTDPKKWGKGKGGMGDGIMGWSDGENGPPGFQWVPNVDVGLKPDFHGPKTMGPDGGFYGGIDIGMLPGQAGKGKRWSKARLEREHKEICKSAWKAAMDRANAEGVLGVEKQMWQDIALAWAEWYLVGPNVSSPIQKAETEDGEWVFVSLRGGARYLYNEDKGVYYDLNEGNMPRPDSGSDGDSSPVRDPQLLLRLTQAADRQQNKPEVVPGVVDPVPIRGSDATGRAGGGELAAAGAAKAEAAWKFSGKKPGSEVTDPAEWQSSANLAGSGIAKDLSLVTDPPEPQAGALGAMGNEPPRLSQAGKALVSQALSQLLIQSIQACAMP